MHSLKKLLLLLITVAIHLPTLAQQVPDSIIKKYNAAKTAKEKRMVMVDYTNSKRRDPDFVAITTTLTDYLKSVGDPETVDYVQLNVNDQLSKTGNYVTALSSALEILNRFEKSNNTNGIMSAYRMLSTIYYYAGDKEKDVGYAKKAARLAKEEGNNYVLSNIYNNLSTSYAQSKEPDSALAYGLLALEYARKTDSLNVNTVSGTLGEAYILVKQYDQALPYIRKSLNESYLQDALGVAWSLNDMAQIFLETNVRDSARYYLRMAIDVSQTNRFHDQLQRAYEYLSRSFEKEKVPDSAFKYLQLAGTIRDSLYTSEKSKQVEGITMREKTRVQEIEKANSEFKNKIKIYSLLGGLMTLCIIAFILYRISRQKQKANKELEKTLADLKTTQQQLIQSEKMASLGELTAGIAHEIQNPLNFVNNFSEVNKELIEELKSEKLKPKSDRDDQLEADILNDIYQNEEKINQHGKRADAIVKGMLQHSRSSSGQKEPTDINALCDEYLRLSYHGLRTKDKSFNATLKTDFDESIGKINIIPQDIGRVVMNLLTNAFYAVNAKALSAVATPTAADYEPTVSIRTTAFPFGEGRGGALITISDNGNGIPKNIIDKIFQPFFTTKPTGQGTGLGLSLSYDIIKAHGGSITLQSEVNSGTTFQIQLPITN